MPGAQLSGRGDQSFQVVNLHRDSAGESLWFSVEEGLGLSDEEQGLGLAAEEQGLGLSAEEQAPSPEECRVLPVDEQLGVLEVERLGLLPHLEVLVPLASR